MNKKRGEPINSLSDAIRAAYRKSGRSINAIALETGVSYASVHGLMNATRDVNMGTAARVCEALGLGLRQVKRKATIETNATKRGQAARKTTKGG